MKSENILAILDDIGRTIDRQWVPTGHVKPVKPVKPRKEVMENVKSGKKSWKR